MHHHRFVIELDAPDDDENADDTEWWADAAAGACTEYGAENVIFLLEDPLPPDPRIRGFLQALVDAMRAGRDHHFNGDAIDWAESYADELDKSRPTQNAWLITITDEGDQDRYVFTDPTWAEWLQSYEPRIGGRLPGGSSTPPSHYVRLTLENIPPTLADLIRAMSPDELEEHDLLTEDAPEVVGELTSGSYLDDKMHFLSQFCERVEDAAGLRRWNIVGEYHTIAY